MNDSGIRNVLQNKKLIGAVVATSLVACAIGVYLVLGHNSTVGQMGYYTSDDGKTYFTGEEQYPPFDHHGHEAVAAFVFSCDGGTTRFVGYMAKYTPEAKLAAAKSKGRNATEGTPGPGNGINGMLIKRPGEHEWVSVDARENASRVREIRDVKCPDGKAAMRIFSE